MGFFARTLARDSADQFSQCRRIISLQILEMLVGPSIAPLLPAPVLPIGV